MTFEDRLPDYNHAIHKNILIEDNTFYLESDGALRAESVDNLKFINNKLYKFNEVRVLSPLPNGPETNSGSRSNVLEFKNSNNILVKDNFYEDGLKKNVLFEGMTKDNYKVKDNLHILTNRDEIINENTITPLKDNIKILELNTDLENFNKVEDVLYIDTQTDNTSISINVKTNRLYPTIIVENEDQNTREIAQNCLFKLNIYNGVNSFKIIASDDNSECITRLIILRHRKILDGIKSIKLGDKDLDIENKIIDFENKYNRKDLQVIANDINAKVEIDFRKDGDKKFVLIRIRHEDGLSLELYKYEIIIAK